MKIIENILTKNRCYQNGRKITVKGLMLHSVGCPQPSAKAFIDYWNSAQAPVCVHAVIDGNDGTVYQTLPWNSRAWHCGSGNWGSGNDSYIAVEVCEPACIEYKGGANFTCSDLVAARAVAERTYKTSAVTLDQNNFCGMGVTANGMKGNFFGTPQLGIRAQVQHLKAYACANVLVNTCVDPRFQFVSRGCASYVEWLGQKENPAGKGWATGEKYREKILAI